MRSRCRPACRRILLALLAMPAAAAAQTTWHVGLYVGAQHASVIDPNSSELRYSGASPALGILLARSTPGSLLELQADYQHSRLNSAVTSGDLPREIATLAGLRALALSRPHALAGGAFRPGVGLLGELAVRDHWYAQPPVASSYLIGAVALGPSAGWTRPLGRGELRAQAMLPLLGVVYRPYSDVESVDGSRLKFRVVALNRLQAPAGGLGWAVPLGRVRAAATWRFAYLRYGGFTVYRQARQSLTAAVELPLGGGR